MAVVRTPPVPSFVRVILVFGTTAPVESVTWPEITPLVCADKLAADNMAITMATMQAIEARRFLNELQVFLRLRAWQVDSSLVLQFEVKIEAPPQLPDASLK